MSVKPFTIAKSLTEKQWVKAIKQDPNNLIESNSKLKKSNIYQWTVPALTASVVKNGKLVTMKTCPMAEACAEACYACQGGYLFKSSMVSHTRKLQAYIDDPTNLAFDIVNDLQRIRKIKALRIHDSGDFFNRTYAMWWINIMKALPNIKFYAYTKQVAMFKKLTEKGLIPDNFTIIYSFGGKQDHMINEKVDRHSKVFSSHAAMKAAGYSDTTEKDDNAANPKIKNVGLVYHGKVKVTTALGGKTVMGQAA